MRLVSLVPSWTETLYALGVGEGLVGRTRYCIAPAERVASVEVVGGTKDPDIARILAIKPDLVVCDHEEQRPEDVKALREAGIDVWLSDVRSLADAVRDTRGLAARVAAAAPGQELLHAIERAIEQARGHSSATKLLAYVPIWRRPWLTPTQDTYSHHVLALAGVANVFGDHEGRYPERDPDEAIEAGAQWALLPTEPYPFATKLAQAQADLIEAGFPVERIVLIDGEALTWYGARMVTGLPDLAGHMRHLTTMTQT